MTSPIRSLDILDLVTLEKRSPTLDGSIPLRAAQGCKPVLEGNAAGFHVCFRIPAAIINDSGIAELQLTDEDAPRVGEGYDAKISALVAGGILPDNGYWHQRLRNGFAWNEGGCLCLFTGRLIKMPDKTHLLVTRAYNRHCQVRVREYVITGSDWVPLVLEIETEGDALRFDTNWLDTELACLLPIRNMKMEIRNLRDDPRAGRAFLDFYSAEYLEERGEGEYSGNYRRLVARQGSEEVEDTADAPTCSLVTILPAAHTVARFERFADGSGVHADHPAAANLEYCIVKNLFEVTGFWDNNLQRDLGAEMGDQRDVARALWAELYGADSVARAEWALEYALPDLGRHRGECYLNLIPWAFIVTPAGWSSVLDGLDAPNLDGMRGVLSSDSYHLVVPVWEIQNVGPIFFPKGVPLSRSIPFPRSLAKLELETERFELADR